MSKTLRLFKAHFSAILGKPTPSAPNAKKRTRAKPHRVWRDASGTGHAHAIFQQKSLEILVILYLSDVSFLLLHVVSGFKTV